MTRIALVMGLGLLIAAPARAQDTSCAEGDADCAREVFGRALERLEAGRFAEARDLLRHALATYPNPASAFNLAVALRGTGESVAASEVLAALEAGEYGELSDAQRAEVATMRGEIEGEVAVLELRVCGGNDVAVRIDGALWERFDGCRDLSRRANAGEHVITATGAGRRPLERRVELVRGEPRRLELALSEIPTGLLVVRVPDDQTEVEVEGIGRAAGEFRRRLPEGTYRVRAFLDRDEPEERRVTLLGGESIELSLGGSTDPWPWIAIGVGLAALGAGAAVLGVLLADDERPLVTDPVFGVTMTLEVGP